MFSDEAEIQLICLIHSPIRAMTVSQGGPVMTQVIGQNSAVSVSVLQTFSPLSGSLNLVTIYFTFQVLRFRLFLC